MSPAIDWSRIESFIGYGRITAPVVFIGMEEGLADESALIADLALRSRFAPVMDLEQAHRGIADGESLFSNSPRRQPTWRVMADVMLHFEGSRFLDATERATARTVYRAKRLGRENGDSLLSELLPYPHRKASSWLYAERFPSRAEYVKAIMPERLRLLAGALTSARRYAIICYGKLHWDHFKALFPGAQWAELGRFEFADWRGMPITLTDHFSSKYFNTDGQLDNLAKMAFRSSS